MNRAYHRLTVAKVKKLAASRKPGMYADGDGLYLAVSQAGVASWSHRFMLAGRAREMGLGPLRDVSLAEAREANQAARQLRRQGLDPIEARRGKQQAAVVAKAKTMTFKACAEAYIAAHRAGWRSAKHTTQWVSSIETYAYPVFGGLPVEAIDVGLVMQVLEPIWLNKTETASRLRGRIESVLDWAATRGYRTGENPARWRGHLENLLPKKSKVAPVKRHAALDYRELPGFMTELLRHDDIGARALAFAILTCTRTSETLGARWSEIDLEARTWTIPGTRMKAECEHRVSLSAPVIAILEGMAALRQGDSDFVFPGISAGHAGENLLRRTLQRLGRPGLTVHGFRSCFSDWCAEQTNFASEVREMALAHKISNAVEAAYRRGDLFAKRSRLMAAWAGYCTSASTVVPLQRAPAAA
jgi:integrase